MKKLIAILGMVAVLSPPFIVAAEQNVLPNGVSRIGAANTTGTPFDFSSVGVAVIDTGIQLGNDDLNVVGGVDCSTGTDLYQAANQPVPGAQRSVWDPLPEEATPTPAAPSEANATSYTPGQSVDTAAQATPAPAVEEPVEEPPISFAELEFRIASQENPYNIGGKNPEAEGFDDGNGHGTHVAGIIGARDDGEGVVGVLPNASLYAVKVLGDQGGGSLDNLICGLDWVAANAHRIQVANMSLGAHTGQVVMEVIEACPDDDNLDDPAYVQQTEKLRDELHEAVCRTVNSGVVLVVAGGNGWGDAGTVIPAAYPEVIAVSSFADFDGKPGGAAGHDSQCPEMGGMDDTFFTHLNDTPGLGIGSFAGETIDIAAPGVCVFSTFPTGYANLTGTSMATPHVTGAVGRIVARVFENVTTESDGSQTEPSESRAQYYRDRLFEEAETQTVLFRDSDDWHEPIVHVAH